MKWELVAGMTEPGRNVIFRVLKRGKVQGLVVIHDIPQLVDQGFRIDVKMIGL